MESRIICLLIFFIAACRLSVNGSSGKQNLRVPDSPCPQLFYYKWDTRSSQYLGALRIPPPQENLKINIVLDLVVNLHFQTEYFGLIDLVEDKDDVANRLEKGDFRSIDYWVHFPIQNPLPMLTQLKVNQKILCSYQQDIHGQYTTLSLKHTLTLPQRDVNIRQPLFNNSLSPLFQIIPTSPAPKNPEIISKEPAIGEIECGLKASGNGQFLVVNGAPFSAGLWPWMSAIFHTSQTGLDFKCGGTLISKFHVITAAHCVKFPDDKKEANPEELLVYLGKHALFSWSETEIQTKEVQRVVIHPQYGEVSTSHQHDLAVLFFKIPANFGKAVRPACLWKSTLSFTNEGTVAGWGKDEQGNAFSNNPKMVVLPVVSQEECLRSNIDLFYLTYNTTFCAGARKGFGPCTGDSGGGMYSVAEGTQKWYLRGVVSLALKDQASMSCDLYNYVVFTDLTKYGKWITEVTGVV